MGKQSTMQTYYAATDNASLTGTFSLQSLDQETGVALGTVTEIDIPKGIRAKIWMKRISGAICTVNTFYNLNPGAATSTSYQVPTNTDVQIGSSDLVSAGQLEEDERRPLICDGLNPGSSLARIQFKWSQTVLGLSYIVIKIEWERIGSE